MLVLTVPYSLAQEDQVTPLPIKSTIDSISAPILPINILDDTVPLDSIQQDTTQKKKTAPS